MHWPLLTVQLQIDEDGLLHINERHEMVFNGNWNGGERTFQMRSWHDLELVSVSEIVPDTGARVALVAGDLDAVNEYQLSGETLRWRSRLQTDPPFANTTKIYEIAYTIEGALLAQGDGSLYRLNHDLAFPNRPGAIERFEATIDLAPVWQAPDVPRKLEREQLAPGQSVFVTAQLHYVGSDEPSAAAKAPEVGSAASIPLVRGVCLASVIALAVLFLLDWLRSERALGRFEAPIPLDQIDESWLAAHVFNTKPEIVGSAWDRTTSSAEVAALIARLVQERKLASTVSRKGWWLFKRDTLSLKLLCPREDFESYERRLIDRLFFDKSVEVDTDAIHARYQKTGFDPAGLIEAPIRKRVPSVFRTRSSLSPWRKWMTAGLLLTGSAMMAWSWFSSPDIIEFLALISVMALILLYVLGLVYAVSYREHVLDLQVHALRAFIAPMLIIVGLAWVLFGGKVPLLTVQLLGLPMLVVGALNSIFNSMHCSQTPQGVQLRRQLGTARRYFERELENEHPRLRDEWFPYLLAFGLGPRVERWFKSFGTNTDTHSHFSAASGSSSLGSTSSGASTWSGGGGNFGGAGASGSWASAVGAVAAGVAAPSSSSGSSGGSGGGGGGGGSSGGGGGGGW